MNHSTKKLTDGAMMCAIVGVVLVIDRQLAGFLVSLVPFLFPLPMVFYSAKYGMKDSWMVFAAMLILSFILGQPQSIFYVVCEGFMGLVYGSGIHDKKDTRHLLIVTMVIGVIANVLSTVVFAAFFGYDMNADIASVKEVLDQSGITLPETMDLDSYLKMLFLITAVLTGILEGTVTHFLSRMMLKRLRFDLPQSESILTYMPPVWTGYAGIAGLVAYFYSVYRPVSNTMLQSVLQGFGMAGYLYLIIFGVVGLIVMGTILNPKMKRWTIVLSILVMFMAAMACAIFGFLYITTQMHRHLLEGGLHAPKND